MLFDQNLVYVRIGSNIIHTVRGEKDKIDMCYAVSTRSDPDESEALDECTVSKFREEPVYVFVRVTVGG